MRHKPDMLKLVVVIEANPEERFIRFTASADTAESIRRDDLGAVSFTAELHEFTLAVLPNYEFEAVLRYIEEMSD